MATRPVVLSVQPKLTASDVVVELHCGPLIRGQGECALQSCEVA
jgi:hypothetical protein